MSCSVHLMEASSSTQPEIVEDDLLRQGKKLVVPPKLFDVFISHRGPDVKETLAFDLYNYLREKGCRAFLDSEEIELGNSIPSTLSDAIRSSKVQIAIFSKRYAESPWCLAELDLMLETGAKFIPVFYGVAPWELRYVKEGKGVYAEAFARHESLGRYLSNLDKWKTALSNASDFSGYELKTNSQYHSMCLKLVSAVEQEVERKRPLDVAKHLVGLDELVTDFESQCGQDREEMNAKVIGIFGMGGSGKTTLAKELFNRKRSNYSRACFVADVRESSDKGEMTYLQAKIMKDLFSEGVDLDFQNISEGKTYLRNRLKRNFHSKYLIVLDDIDGQDQFDALLCTDALGSASLVIITTRDKRVLTRVGVAVQYNLKEMDTSKATELFCWYAFKRPNPDQGYEGLVGRFVQLCQGLPLSLEVFGGLVFGSSDKQYWQWELEKVEKVLPRNLKKRLKISFDALDSEERQIFLDIACFFIGKPESMAITIWKGSGWTAEHALQSLKDKCLVEVGYKEGYAYGDLVLRMHDHLRDMGREIADDLSYPRRLWHPKFLKSLEPRGFQNILTETNGRCLHSVLDQSIGSKVTYFVGESNAVAERSTVLLWLELDFKERQLRSIPSWIPLQSLQSLRIVNGRLKRLWQDDLECSCSSWPFLQCLMRTIRRSHQKTCPCDPEVPLELKELLLKTTVLKEFPNTLGKLIYLENLNLKGKYSNIYNSKFFSSGMVIEGRSFSESLRKLSKLRSLVLWDFFLRGELDFSNDKNAASFGFSQVRCMSHLQTIHIHDVKLTSKISICGENCPSLDSLRLDCMENLAEVHLRNVSTLSSIQVMSCKKLKTISGSFDLGKLETLNIKGCSALEEVPNLSCLTSLEKITIDQCPKLQNINGIEDLDGLKNLYVSTDNGGVAVWSCIQRLKRLPSECATVIGRAVDGVDSTLNANFFSGMISPDAVTELVSQNREPEDSVKMAGSLSAVIICALVESIGWRSFAPGKRIVTIVLTGQKRIYRHHSPDSRLDLLHAELKQKWVVTVNRQEEFKALNIFKTIIAQLYQGIP